MSPWRDYLRRLPLFEGLAEDDLERLLGMARERELAAGEVLIREGDEGDEMYVILEGELAVSQRDGSVERPLAKRVKGEVVGEMSVLDLAARTATVKASTPARLLVIDRAAFGSLLACSVDVGTSILKTVMGRLRGMEAVLMQREKLAALGTMAAGLAHELNNPAAALRRSSAELEGVRIARERAVAALFDCGLSDQEMAEVLALSENPKAPRAGWSSVDDDEVDALTDELRSLGVERPWEAAPALLEGGWTRAALNAVVEGFEPSKRAAVVAWLAAGAASRSVIEEIQSAATAISDLVGSVKEYAYMDRAAVAIVDVHAGLENTLRMLRHKLKGGVTVVREFAAGSLEIEALGSELNQVWTNLIDNAVAAMQGAGTLTLTTRDEGEQVAVEITDTGPGIPAAVVPRLFEPFFTTKGVGEGNGLGLYIAWDVVVQRHGGRIKVDSQPLRTTFTVTLPRRLAPGRDADETDS